MSKTIEIDTQGVQGQWPLPLSSEMVDDIWECDWEDQICPTCNRDLDRHDNRTITRCATA